MPLGRGGAADHRRVAALKVVLTPAAPRLSGRASGSRALRERGAAAPGHGRPRWEGTRPEAPPLVGVVSTKEAAARPAHRPSGARCGQLVLRVRRQCASCSLHSSPAPDRPRGSGRSARGGSCPPGAPGAPLRERVPRAQRGAAARPLSPGGVSTAGSWSVLCGPTTAL